MGDDDKQDDGFDPWAELESSSGPDPDATFDVSFDDEPVEGPAAPAAAGEERPVEFEARAGVPAETGEGFRERDDDGVDDEVADWLADVADHDGEPTTLGVFAGDDESASSDPADPAAVRVGFGESGIIDDDAGAASGDGHHDSATSSLEPHIGWEDVDVAAAIEPAPFGVVGSDAGDHADEGVEFEAMAGGGEAEADVAEAGAATVAMAAAGVAEDQVPAKRRAAKKGGLGQILGVVLGGLLALPITFAILVWGFRTDPLHLVRHVPPSVAFLFPQELVRGTRAPASRGAAGGPTLDDVPAVVDLQAEPSIPDEPTADPVVESAVDPVVEPVAAAISAPAEPSSEPPMATIGASVADVPPLGESASEVMGVDPAAVAVAAAAAPVDVPAPSADPFGDLSPVMPVPSEPLAPAEPQVTSDPQEAVPPAISEPEPLDVSAVENAVAAAADAYEAVRAADGDVDPEPARRTRRRNRLLVEWYRQVSLVAEELSALERVAADTGRPLESPPEAVTRLQDATVSDPVRLADLKRLSRDWLAYKGRSTSGIMMPAVLAGVRHVGPYWCATVTVADGGDRTRDMVVISRSEPAAAPGDAVLVTGLIVDGDTLWASDVRPAVAGAATTSDPFATPAP